MADLPSYLQDQTEGAILQRMLDRLSADLDKSEGSYLWDALSPAAIELALAAIWAQEVLRRGFASTTFGEYLDKRCEEHGVTRRQAVKASGQVTFSGTVGAVIPAGTRVSTTADPVLETLAVEFVTTAQATIGGSGSVIVGIEASEAGLSGNVPANTINLLLDPLPGVASVNNTAATSGGLDTESDESLLARYLFKVQNPSAGGNKADYINWAMEVSGVGAVRFVPVKYGNGTCSIAIVDTNKEPPSQALIDAVQNYIAPAWSNGVEAESMTLEGFGASIDTTQTDDTGDSVKMIYNASGAGTITHSLSALLQQPGIWQARARVKVDSIAGATDLLQIGVYNFSNFAWCKTTPSGLVDAVMTLKASDLATSFADKIQQFYWNGIDIIELRITRLISDTNTIVWVDRVVYRSMFTKDTGEGKAPVGARVYVEAPGVVTINVSATLTLESGVDVVITKAAVEQNIKDYIKSLTFKDDNDVRYVRIGQAILDTPGVKDYSGLLVNGGTVNITVGEQEIAVPGTITLN